jgi:hypothetical protein
MFRRGTRKPLLWNIAYDLVINTRLIRSGLEAPSGNPIGIEQVLFGGGRKTDERSDGDGLDYLYDKRVVGMSEEEVYDLLLQTIEQQCACSATGGGDEQTKSGGGGESCDETTSGSAKGKNDDAPGEGMPDYLRDLDYANEDDPTAQEAARATVQAAAEAAYEIAKQRGPVPAYLEELLERLDHWKPKVDWRRRLAHLFRSHASAQTELTYTRPNRWSMVTGSPVLLPGELSYGIGRILVGVDTSASMDTELLRKAFAELKALVRTVQPERVLVMEVDVESAAEYEMTPAEFTNWWPEQVHGRGGTSFEPVMEKAKEVQPEVVVYFTDGYGDDPEPPKGVPVIWVLLGSDYLSASFGEKVVIEEEE